MSPQDNAALRDVIERALGYAQGIDCRRVVPEAAALDALRQLDEPWPTCPSDPALTLRKLDQLGSPATMATTGGRYFGFVTGATLPVALGADWLLSSWDQPAALPVMSPAVAAFEAVAARWVLEALDLPRDSAVAFPTGASHGNLVALAAARRALLLRQSYDVDEDGLSGAPPLRVIVSDETHSTLIKGLGILGLGRRRAEVVSTDNQGRMRLDALPALDASTLVCAQVGNVNSGACDPVGALAQRCRDAGAWLHVDGAFGLWGRAAPSLAGALAGVEHADSWVTDAHKWLNTPYDGGIVICRDRASLVGAMGVQAAYMPRAEQTPAKDMLMEFSRRARGVPIWAALHCLGRQGLAALIEGCCAHARRLAKDLSGRGWLIHNEVVLNQLVASPPTPAQARAVQAQLEAGGRAWVGLTQWRGVLALRISVSSWATTGADIDALVEALEQACAAAQAAAARPM